MYGQKSRGARDVLAARFGVAHVSVHTTALTGQSHRSVQRTSVATRQSQRADFAPSAACE